MSEKVGGKMVVDEGVTYKRAGTYGAAPSTVTGKERAIDHFNDFLRTKKMPAFKDLNEQQLCNITLFQEYGTYLSEHARKKNKVRVLCWLFSTVASLVYLRYRLRLRAISCSSGVPQSST